MNIRFIDTEENVTIRFPLLFFIILLMFSGCTEQQTSGNVVARVNDQVLTMEMIRENSDSSQLLTQGDIQQYANRWISNELLFQEARSRGYDASDEIQKKIAEARKQLSVVSLLEKEVYSIDESSIRRDEIASYFQSHSGEFLLKENIVRLSLAVFRDFETANQFRSEALSMAGWENSLKKIRSESPENLLTSTDSIFYSQTSLYPPELWKVATALGMFEVSFPIKTSAGFVVMRSLGLFRSNTVAPLSYVENEIRSRITMDLRQTQYQKFLQSLRSKHTVQLMISKQDSLGRN